MASELERKERCATLVSEGFPPVDLPPIRPRGCSLEFWGGVVGIDRSLRVWEVSHPNGEPISFASQVGQRGELSPRDRKALAEYMVDLWQRFGAAD